MSTAHTELQRGDQAQAAIDNPLITEALDAWEQEITQAWKSSPLRDVEGREKLRLMLEAAVEFRKYLQTTIDTGQLQRVQIERQRPTLQELRPAQATWRR